MYTLQPISRKIITSLFIFFLLCGFSFITDAQNGYVAPRKSSEQAVIEYRNSHYANTSSSSTINIAVPTKKDAEIIQALAIGADITNDQYYAKIIDESNARSIRNGQLPSDRDSWKSRIAGWEADEWPAKFPPPFSFNSGYATVQHHGRFGVIDESGHVIIPIIWQWASTFSSGLSFVKSTGLDGKCGFMDKANRLVIPLKYEDCLLGFRGGLAPVKLNGKWGYIDPNDGIVVPFVYDEAKELWNGLGIVKQKNKYGVVDKAGTEIIPVKFSSMVHLTHEKMFVFEQKGKWGAFDEKGAVIIEPIYKEAFYYRNDKAKVTLKSRTFYIDRTGLEVPAP